MDIGSHPIDTVEQPTDRTVMLHRDRRGLHYVATGELHSMLHGADEFQAAAAIRLLATVASRLPDPEVTTPRWEALLTQADPEQQAFRTATRAWV